MWSVPSVSTTCTHGGEKRAGVHVWRAMLRRCLLPDAAALAQHAKRQRSATNPPP